MRFALEKISDEDKRRILADASAGGGFGPAVQLAKYGETYWEEGPAWAIESRRRSYLIRAPLYSECGTSQRFYYFFSDGSWFKLARRAPMSDQVAIEGQERISPDLLVRLKAQITAAFAVFGERGERPDSADRRQTIVPVFVGVSRHG